MTDRSEYSIKLETSTKYDTLYKWCLQEIDDKETQIGDDWIPWGFSTEFDFTNLQYRHTFGTERHFLFGVNKSIEQYSDSMPQAVLSRETITCKLSPSTQSRYATTYSMFGSNRTVSSFTLHIVKSSQSECFVWGSISQVVEFDFERRKQDDLLEVHITLPATKFDELVKLANAGTCDKGSLRLTAVNGFYSRWTPEISTDRVKILCPAKDEQRVLNAVDDSEIPLRLGQVGEFSLSLGRTVQLDSARLSGKFGETQNQTNSQWGSDSADEMDCKSWADNEMAKQITDAIEYTTRTSAILTSDDDTQVGDEAKDISHSAATEQLMGDLKHSRRRKMQTEMLQSVARFSTNTNLDEDERSWLASDTNNFFDELGRAFQEDAWYDHTADIAAHSDFLKRLWSLWGHKPFSVTNIKRGAIPHFDQLELASATNSYLDLPITCKQVERLLVDALIASTLYPVAKELLYAPRWLKPVSMSPLAQSHPLVRFLTGHTINFIALVATPILALMAIVWLFNIEGDWPIVVGAVTTSIWGLLFVIGLIALPNFWITSVRNKRIAQERLDAMHMAYLAMGADGPISAKYVWDRLTFAAEKGIVWPAELFALLDRKIANNEFI